MRKVSVHTVICALCLGVIASCSSSWTDACTVTGPDGTQWQTMTVERLPDLNVSRGNHRTLLLGDEIVVLGGHTEGFKPLETAEYYSGGAWHSMPMLYPHQNGFAAQLPGGRILLGGGSAEAFGIGQSWGAEVYAPASHSFTAQRQRDLLRQGGGGAVAPLQPAFNRRGTSRGCGNKICYPEYGVGEEINGVFRNYL